MTKWASHQCARSHLHFNKQQKHYIDVRVLHTILNVIRCYLVSTISNLNRMFAYVWWPISNVTCYFPARFNSNWKKQQQKYWTTNTFHLSLNYGVGNDVIAFDTISFNASFLPIVFFIILSTLSPSQCMCKLFLLRMFHLYIFFLRVSKLLLLFVCLAAHWIGCSFVRSFHVFVSINIELGHEIFNSSKNAPQTHWKTLISQFRRCVVKNMIQNNNNNNDGGGGDVEIDRLKFKINKRNKSVCHERRHRAAAAHWHIKRIVKVISSHTHTHIDNSN